MPEPMTDGELDNLAYGEDVGNWISWARGEILRLRKLVETAIELLQRCKENDDYDTNLIYELDSFLKEQKK